MQFTEEKLQQMAADALDLIRQYKNKYYDLKKSVDTSAEYKVIWADGHDQPYHADYLSDIENMPERKIFRSEPRKKEYRAKHYFQENMPVYSVGFDNHDEAGYEWFFIRTGNVLIGAKYTISSGILLELSAEFYDGNGRPVEYWCIAHADAAEPVLGCCIYQYEAGYIIAADCIRDFYIARPAMRYDHPLYQDWGKDLDRMLRTPPMNPQHVYTYQFIYGDSGAPVSYARTGYSYNTVTTGTWKAKKSLFSRFSEYGILWFNKP